MGKCSNLICKYFSCYCAIRKTVGSDLNVRCVCVFKENFIFYDCINIHLTSISNTHCVLLTVQKMKAMAQKSRRETAQVLKRKMGTYCVILCFGTWSVFYPPGQGWKIYSPTLKEKQHKDWLPGELWWKWVYAWKLLSWQIMPREVGVRVTVHVLSICYFLSCDQKQPLEVFGKGNGSRQESAQEDSIRERELTHWILLHG